MQNFADMAERTESDMLGLTVPAPRFAKGPLSVEAKRGSIFLGGPIPQYSQLGLGTTWGM